MKKMLLLVTLLGGAAALGIASQVATYSENSPETTVSPSNAANPIVVMGTSMGTIKIELFQDKSPITVKNFLDYVDAHHYDGTIFHRVIADFMIQGGGFGTDLKEKETRGPIKNEADNGLANKRGTLAMARTNDPNSASAQFFINVKDNSFLDRANARDGVGYAVFGQVIEGMDVVDKIRAVRTGQRTLSMRDKSSGRVIEAPSNDVPLQNVEIKSVKRAK